MLTLLSIVVNNIIYVFYEKLEHIENKLLLKETPLSFMIIGCLKEVN
jgi:hypothetical protein